MIISKNSLNHLKLCFIFVLFFPGFYKYTGLKIEQLITVIACLLSLIFIVILKMRMNKSTYFTSYSIAMVFFLLLLISLIRAVDIFVISDVFELAKPVFFLLFFYLGFTVIWNEDNLKKFFSFFLSVCVFLVLFGYFEALTPLGNYISINFYKADKTVLVGKAVGPFIITYAFATFLIFPFYCFLCRSYFSDNLINKNLFLALLTLGAIFLTQSKTVFLAILSSLFLFHFLYPTLPSYSSLPNRKRVFIVGILVLVVLISSFALLLTFFETNFAYIYNGLSVVIRFLWNDGIMAAINSNPSTGNRFEQFIIAFENQDTIPMIGVGIGKGLFMPESFYALYLYRVGLIGIFVHFAILFYFFRLSLKNGKKLISLGKYELASVFIGFHFYILALPVCYLASAINDQTRTGFVVYIFYAINISTNIYLKKYLKSK